MTNITQAFLTNAVTSVVHIFFCFVGVHEQAALGKHNGEANGLSKRLKLVLMCVRGE